MRDIIWILRPKKDNLDYIELVVKISNNEDINLSDYDIGQVKSVVHTFKEEIVKYLLEHGFTSLVSSELLLEHIVTKGTPDSKIVPIVQLYLDKVTIDNELIIVDPYFFAKPKNPNYITVLENILSKYLPTIDDIIIITNSYAVDATVKNSIISMLKGKKATLNVTHKQTNDYHDRYWISGGRQKGIVIGTSLNSLGNKVALLDRLNTSDVRSIVKELTDDGLL